MKKIGSTRRSTSTEPEFQGYRRRPYSLIEKRLGSQFESVENLLPFEQYHGWASSIIRRMPRTKEMEITRAWLQFISKNRKLPVMYDYIRLFVFSLHLRYRVRPFDAKPKDSFLKQPRFDVVNGGRILISRLVALEQKMNSNGDFACKIQMRDMDYSKCLKPIYGKHSKTQNYFPRIHISDNRDKNTKEYFATQGIPGFGRHCWYTVADDRYPYYYDQSMNQRNRKDILGRLADHLHHMEKGKDRPLTQRDVERFRLTTRDWWTWHDPGHSFVAEGPNPEDQNFQWYKHSILTKGFNYKLDKKHIKKIMDDEIKEVTLGYRPIPKCVLRNVLGLDIDDSSISNLKITRRHTRKYGSRSPSTSAKRASIAKWLDDLDLLVNQEIPETRDQHFSPGSPFQRSTPSPFQKRRMQSPCGKRITPSPCGRRKVPSPCERRRTPSPCPRSTPSPYPWRRTPSPCPWRSTPSPCPWKRTPSPPPRGITLTPRPRRSTPSPFERRRTPSPCPRRSTPSPYPWRRTPSPCPWRSTPSPSPWKRTPSPRPRRSTPSPCLRRSTPSPCPRRSTPKLYPGRSTPSPCPSRSTPSPCPRRNTPVFDTDSNVYSKDATFTREITERIGDPNGPPEMVNAAISGWLDQLESSLRDVPSAKHTQASKSPTRPCSSSQGGFARQSTRFGGTFIKYSSPSGTEEGFFGPGEASSGLWGEPIEDDTYPDVIESEQDFADEMAQFEAQTGAGWGEKSESSLDFENVKELSFADQFLLPTADFQFDEEAQAAAADAFGGFDEPDDDWVAPPEIVPCDTQQAVPLPMGSEETENRRAGKLFLPQPNKTEDTTLLERISWPNRSHLYDINTDFPETDRPFDFLDVSQLRNIEDMGDICEEIPEEEERWLNLADIADQIGQKLM